MSDNANLKQVKDNYTGIIRHEEMRDVFSLKEGERFNDKSREYRDYHSLESARDESLKIGQILEKAQELNLSPEQQTDLMLRDNRNKNLILVNSEKWSGDSGFMARIKNGILTYESMIRQGSDVNGVISQIDEVLDACDKYLGRHRSIFIWRWSRYNAVSETRDRFLREKEMLENLGQSKMKETSQDEETGPENNLLSAMKRTRLSRRVESEKKKKMAEKGGILEESHRRITQKQQQLLDSKVTHLGISFSDSERMVNLKNAVTSLRTAMEKTMPGDLESFSESLSKITVAYATMMAHCQAYITYIESNKKGTGSSGRARLELVKEILAQSKKELTVFKLPAKELFKEYQGSGSWHEILYSARAKKLSEKDPSVTKMGAGTSTVYKTKDENGKTVYIKAEERIGKDRLFMTLFKEYGKQNIPGAKELTEKLISLYMEYRGQGKWQDVETEGFNEDTNELCDVFYRLANVYHKKSTIKRKQGESDSEFKNRVEEVVDSQIRATMEKNMSEGMGLAPIKEYIQNNYDLFIDMANYIIKKRTEFEVAGMAGITPESTISTRNVSTSRIAKRLGTEDMIAESETVLIEKEDGTLTRANSMEGVEGYTLMELMNKAKINGINIKLSPLAAKQLLQLQVMDLICGQIDRHKNNIVVSYEETGEKEYTLRSIKGIDNDLSFGALLTDLDMPISNLRPLLDAVDRPKISVPYLSEDFYNKIMAYDTGVAALDQKDIRTKEETDALEIRLKKVQDDLRKYVEEGKIKLISSESDWEKAIEELSKMHANKELGRNYLSTLFE